MLTGCPHKTARRTDVGGGSQSQKEEKELEKKIGSAACSIADKRKTVIQMKKTKKLRNTHNTKLGGRGGETRRSEETNYISVFDPLGVPQRGASSAWMHHELPRSLISSEGGGGKNGGRRRGVRGFNTARQRNKLPKRRVGGIAAKDASSARNKPLASNNGEGR